MNKGSTPAGGPAGRFGGVLRARPGGPAGPARTPFVLLVVVLLGGGLITLLLLNSALNEGSFHLSRLKKDTTALTDEQQALQKDVDAFSAPDALERRARELGLVPGGSPVFLGPDGKLNGVPSTASAPPPDPVAAPPAAAPAPHPGGSPLATPAGPAPSAGTGTGTTGTTGTGTTGTGATGTGSAGTGSNTTGTGNSAGAPADPQPGTPDPDAKPTPTPGR